MILDSQKFTGLDHLIGSEISFALFRLPGESDFKLIAQESGDPKQLRAYEDISTEAGFVVAPFATSIDNPILLIHPDIYLDDDARISEYLKTSADRSFPIQAESFTNEESVAKDCYSRVFDSFNKELQNKSFDKLVLSRNYTIEKPTGFSWRENLLRAGLLYSDAFVYLFYTPSTGCWMGATPEILLSGSENVYTTVALAGTMKSGICIKPEWSAKNKGEQNVVVRYMRECIGSLADTYEEFGPDTVKAGDLIHLKSTFHFKANKNLSLGKILSMFHPTPAVCGLPKEKAYQYIIDHEGYNRSYYSGFLGPIMDKESINIYVNLRCMHENENKLTLYAGGGILPQSEVTDEWQETENKLQTMLRLLVKSDN
ncbi:MAG: isochorismate synthase [Tannerellaceae bacterium]